MCGGGVLCAAGSGLPRPGTAGSEAVWGWHGQRGWLGEGRVVRAAGLGAPSVLCIKSAVRQPEAHWGSWGHPESTGILCDVEMSHWREEVHASGPRQHRVGERELWVFLPGSLLTWATGFTLGLWL